MAAVVEPLSQKLVLAVRVGDKLFHLISNRELEGVQARLRRVAVIARFFFEIVIVQNCRDFGVIPAEIEQADGKVFALVGELLVLVLEFFLDFSEVSKLV